MPELTLMQNSYCRGPPTCSEQALAVSAALLCLLLLLMIKAANVTLSLIFQASSPLRTEMLDCSCLLYCLCRKRETGLVLLVVNALAAVSRCSVNAVGGIDFSFICLHCYSH